MEKKDYTLAAALFAVILLIVVWARQNIFLLKPYLEESTLTFQLIAGATAIAISRNVIGIKTFGVFAPTIIAIGLSRNVSPLLGLALYGDVFIFSVFATLALYSLALSSSFRVAVLITLIALVLTILNFFGRTYGIDILSSAIFFPILITSWAADRFVVMAKETSWKGSLNMLAGTIGVTAIAYFVISAREFIGFIAVNPEAWLAIILADVAIALKASFRLSEHLRFAPAIKRGVPRRDILGMNRRNQEYIFAHNPRNVFAHIAKDLMKITLHRLDIPAPKTYGIIRSFSEIQLAEKVMKELAEFVIKPSKGSGGEGILVLKRKGKKTYIAKGREYSIEDLKNHIHMILDGQYSGERSDAAIIEEKLEVDPVLKKFYWNGVPDIRVIVFEGFPVMAMIRLPTKESEGLANIHKGAIGVGLSISEGRGVSPYWKVTRGIIEKHPDTGALLSGIKIRGWENYLQIACRVQAASRLGYAGVDIVPSAKGPVVLEVNKRPGLEIQNTNMAGLLARLEFVEKKLAEHGFKPLKERVKLAQAWDRKGWKL